MVRAHSVLCLLLVTLVAGCSPRAEPAANRPERGEAAAPPVQLQSPPVHALLGYRDRLALTSEQITALDSIGVWLQTENAPHLAELRSAMGVGHGMIGPVRTGRGRVSEEAQALIDRITGNNRAATEGVRSVLGEDQQAQVCELFAAQPGAGGPGGGRMLRGGGGGAGPGRVRQRPGAGRAPEGMLRRSPWDWCAAPAGAAPRPEGDEPGT